MVFVFRRPIAQLIVAASLSIFLTLQGKCALSFDVTSSSSSRRNAIAQFQRQQQQQQQQQQRKNLLRSNNNTSLELLYDDNDNDNYSVNNSNRRRGVLGAMLSIPFSLIIPLTRPPSAAAAAAGENAEKKPFAPLENLLPAVRVKLSIDSAIGLTKSLLVGDDEQLTTATKASTFETSTTTSTTLEQLENILLKPQNYVQTTLKLHGVPPKPADLYLQSYKPMKGDLPFQRYLIQNGDVDAWKRLKKREKTMERSSEIRTALNAYTDALSFSADSYLLNVDKETRSSMVRQDRLPDVKQVITSDMGMRYLYRNQVLTAMDDVKAELEYQLTLTTTTTTKMEKQDELLLASFDGSELLDLLGLAGEAMDRWLSLVPPKDVKEAFGYAAEEYK